MKKLTILTVAFLIIAAGSYMAFSQEQDDLFEEDDQTEQHFEYGRKLNPMCMMKAHSAMQAQILPTADGGIIVMAGGKLYKYDQNLTLQNEVEIRIDVDHIQNQMNQLMSDCPVYQQMRRQMQQPNIPLTNGTNGDQNKEKQRERTKTPPAKSPE